MDPVVLVRAMAAATKPVAFGSTGSTSYIPPYMLARTRSTRDTLSKERVAWNVITSYSNSAAKSFALEKVKPSAERYEAAAKYMDLCYQLWEKSCEDDAVAWQVESEIAYDPSKIHWIDYDGKHHKLFAYGSVPPSPQRTPVIFQAGASKSGIDFVGEHAEAIYTGYSTIKMLKEYVDDIPAAAVRHGRNPGDVKIFAAMCPILGETASTAMGNQGSKIEIFDYATQEVAEVSFVDDMDEHPLARKVLDDAMLNNEPTKQADQVWRNVARLFAAIARGEQPGEEGSVPLGFETAVRRQELLEVMLAGKHY